MINKNASDVSAEGLYSGETFLGLRHGKGTLFYKSQSQYEPEFYEGFWKNGLKWGFGKEKQAKSLFYGHYLNNVRSGRGILLEKGQQPLVGQWEYNQYSYFKQKQSIVAQKKRSKEHLATFAQLENTLKTELKQFKNHMLNSKGQQILSNSNALQQQNVSFHDGQYFGQVQDGQRQGKGRLTYSDGSCYEGQWIRNVRSGFGVYQLKDQRFEGFWENDKLNGKGSQYLNQNLIYHGDWKDGMRSGQGFEQSDSAQYLLFYGSFVNNEREGEGTQIKIVSKIFSNNNNDKSKRVLIGNWRKQNLNGVGWCYQEKEQLIYIGEFKNKTFCGYGALYNCQNQDNLEKIYEGEWNNDQEEGMGFLRISRYVYLGQFQKSKFHGYGHLYELSELEKLGIVIDQSAKGESNYVKDKLLKDNELLTYIGNFENGKKHGDGLLELRNNVSYKGEFKLDNLGGNGVFKIVNSQATFSGEFQNNRFKGEVTGMDKGYYDGDFSFRGRSGNGEMKWENQERYLGEWQNNLMHGKGSLYDAKDICIYSGTFTNGMISDNTNSSKYRDLILTSFNLKIFTGLEQQKIMIQENKQNRMSLSRLGDKVVSVQEKDCVISELRLSQDAKAFNLIQQMKIIPQTQIETELQVHNNKQDSISNLSTQIIFNPESKEALSNSRINSSSNQNN